MKLLGEIQIIGIAKKLEEIFFYGDKYPLYLDKRSQTLKVIQNLRNEAHRFGITHHRNKRSKITFSSILDDIEGIGEKTKEKLLTFFGSVKQIKKSNRNEIEKLIGKGKTATLLLSLKKK